MVNVEEILKQFEELNIKPSDAVLSKCLEMCLKYNFNAEDFVNQWSAFTLSNLNGDEPTLAHLEKMERKELQKNKDLKKTITTPSRLIEDSYQGSYLTTTTVGLNESDSTVLGTPKSVRPQVSRITTPLQTRKITDDSILSSPGIPNVNYSQRTDARSVRCTFGPSSNVKYKRESDLSVDVSNFHNDALKPNATYMYEVMGRKAKSINNMAEWLGLSIADKYKLVVHEGFLRQNMGEMTTYGRIVSDSNGKLNSQSILLEGTHENNMGYTVNLNINKVPKYSLFPGQVVAVKGNHLNTNVFIVEEVYADAGLELSSQPPVTAETMQIVVACGPFTTQDNLLYEPLEDLLRYVTEHRPHVLLLMGPFLDQNHKAILESELTETVDTFFGSLMEKIMSTLENTNIQVVVVSSNKDAHHHPVYPTPPYAVREKYSNLSFVSDPCLLNVNGLVIGGTTVDVLCDVSNYEIYLDKTSSGSADRMGRIAGHLLKQHSFYPLDPPNKELSMDHELLERYGVLDVKPHILILPSNLKHFIKNVDNCLVINPERITKGGCAAGTFARIQINPGETTSICDRTSCEILKI